MFSFVVPTLVPGPCKWDHSVIRRCGCLIWGRRRGVYSFHIDFVPFTNVPLLSGQHVDSVHYLAAGPSCVLRGPLGLIGPNGSSIVSSVVSLVSIVRYIVVVIVVIGIIVIAHICHYIVRGSAPAVRMPDGHEVCFRLSSSILFIGLTFRAIVRSQQVLTGLPSQGALAVGYDNSSVTVVY
jgi:hypothetical protein